MFSDNSNLRNTLDRYPPNELRAGINYRSYTSPSSFGTRKSSSSDQTVSKFEIENLLKYYQPDSSVYQEDLLEYPKYHLQRIKNNYTKITSLKIESHLEYPLTSYINKHEKISLREWNFSLRPITQFVQRYVFELDFSRVIIKVISRPKTDPSYELQLEMKMSTIRSRKFVKFEQEVYIIMKIAYGTAYIYPVKHYREVISKLNSLVNSKSKRLDPEVVTSYQPLSRKQLKVGTIIQNPSTIYTVSHLIKGTRTYFIIAQNSIWLLDASTGLLNRILPYMQGMIVQLFQKLDGMIMDGVLVPISQIKPEDRSNYEGYDHIFYIYDMLNAGMGRKLSLVDTPFISLDQSNQRYNIQRIELIKRNFTSMYDRIRTHGTLLNYWLYLSPIEQIGIVENKILNQVGNPIGNFNYIMAKLFQDQSEVVYPIQGLLFKANQDTYFNTSTLKWQSFYELTLLVKREGREWVFYTRDQKLFRGSLRRPFKDTMLDDNSSLLDKIEPQGSIVTFKWNDSTFKLVPTEIHLDGASPDSAEEAEAIWEAIHSQITKETLQGDNHSEFIYYQNDLRFELISEAISKLGFKPNVVDLNLLPSSLLQYYSGAKRVVAFVNPEDDLYDIKISIEEIYGFRVKVFDNLVNTSHKIVLLNVKLLPQLSNIARTYLDDKIDLVVSFYIENLFINQTKLIAQYLKGLWLYIDLNGDVFEPNLNDELNTQLAIDGEPLFRVNEKSVDFNLDLFPELPYAQSKVYRTHLDDLILTLREFGIENILNRRCDGRKMLNERAYLLSSLFQYGYFANTSVSIKEKKKDSRYAYVMLLMLGDKYIPGIIATAYSLKATGTPYDVVLMHTNEVSKEGMKLLQTAKVIDKFVLIEKLNYPFNASRMVSYYENMMQVIYTKWQILRLTQYDKTLFVDADMVVTENIDALFDLAAPAAYFGMRGATEYESLLFGLEGILKDYSKIKYSIITGDPIPSSVIEKGLHESHVLNAGLVLLEPNDARYEEMIDVLENTSGGFGFPECASGPDEQILAYLYLKHNTDWTALGAEYNFNVPKPGRLLVEGKYKSPKVIHFTRASKPWQTAMRSQKQQFLTDKIWMYYFWRAIQNSKLSFNQFKSLIDPERLDYLLKSKNLSRFKYDLGWFDQKYFPWAFNDDVEPKELKGVVNRYGFVWYVDNKTQTVIDALISALSMLKSGAGSDRILIANGIKSEQLNFIKQSHVFTKVIEVNDDPVIARLEVLKLQEYNKIILLDASTLAYELLSFLFNLATPGGLFDSFSYKHAQRITNSVVRKQLDLNYGVNDALIVLRPSQSQYERALKVYQSRNYGRGQSNDFEKVMTFVFSENPSKKNWTYISPEYSTLSEKPIKNENARAIRAVGGKWDYQKDWFKLEWSQQKKNLWIASLRDLISYIEDYGMKPESLEVLGLTKNEITDLLLQMDIENIETLQLKDLKDVKLKINMLEQKRLKDSNKESKKEESKDRGDLDEWRREQIKMIETKRAAEIKAIESKRNV